MHSAPFMRLVVVWGGMVNLGKAETIGHNSSGGKARTILGTIIVNEMQMKLVVEPKSFLWNKLGVAVSSPIKHQRSNFLGPF